MTDLVAELERLMSHREALVREVASIDQQLERARAAIGMPVASRSRVKATAPRIHRQRTHGNEHARLSIISALEKAEPQRVSQLVVNSGVGTAGNVAAQMVRDGSLVRRKGRRPEGLGAAPYWYARSVAAFDGHPDIPTTQDTVGDGDDELG